MAHHHFKPRVNTKEKEYTPKAGYKLWECKKCDTIVMYPMNLSEHDVNRLVELSKLICIPILTN